jgi:hypothetical protein
MKKAIPHLLAPIVALALALGFISCGAGGNDGPKSISVASISLDKASMPLDVGESGNLVATILPADATNKNVSYSSSNPNVASVSGTGLTAIVTAASAGPATITVTTADGSKTATCDVTVTEPDSYDTEFALIRALEEFWPKVLGRNLTEAEQARYSDELKDVFVKAYARDSYSKNLPFSSEEIKAAMTPMPYRFPYSGATHFGNGIVLGTLGAAPDVTIHETGHYWGLGESLTELLRNKYLGNKMIDNQSGANFSNLCYSPFYDNLLLKKVGTIYLVPHAMNQSLTSTLDHTI